MQSIIMIATGCIYVKCKDILLSLLVDNLPYLRAMLSDIIMMRLRYHVSPYIVINRREKYFDVVKCKKKQQNY